MILNDYYKFTREAIKSKQRLDCTASTESYPTFEEKRATDPQRATGKRDAINVGDLVAYFGGVPANFKGDPNTDKVFSMKGKSVSSVYMPDHSSPFAYGDVKGTLDAILFVMDGLEVDSALQPDGVLEVFIARGQGKNAFNLWQLANDGALDDELEELRAKARPFNEPTLFD